MGFLILWPAGIQAQGEEWEWQNPLPTASQLEGVWSSSGSDVFAEGHNTTFLHYHGKGGASERLSAAVRAPTSPVPSRK